MPSEALINQIEDILDRVVSLGGKKERTSMVPNLTVIDSSPTGLDNFIIVSDDRDGDNILATKVGSIIYANGDKINTLFVEGTEAVAFQQGSESPSTGNIWEIVPATTTDIFYDKGNVRISDNLQHDGDIDTQISFATDTITFDAGGVTMLSLIEAAQNEVVINDDQGDVDFRVEGDNQECAIFLRASDDVVFMGRDDDVTGITLANTSLVADREARITADGASAQFIAIAHGTSVFAFMSSRRARGTEASPSAVLANDNLFRIGGAGYGATGFAVANRADIDIVASQNWTDANQGTYIRMRTTPNNSTGRQEVMRLHQSQNASFGTTSDLGQLAVDQTSLTAAEPVLYLKQDDLSEEMIEFATTIGVGNPIEAIGAKALTTTHFIRVTLPGGLSRYIPAGTIA